MAGNQAQAPAIDSEYVWWQRVTKSLWISTGVVAGLGTIGIAMYSLSARGDTGVDWLQVGGVLSMVSMAAVAIGALFGFLFGVPRARAEVTGAAGPNMTVTPGHNLPNTNLEQVSDWLTKILLGATLTQIGRIPDAAREIFGSVGGSLGVGKSGEVFTGATILFGLTAGFILGWLATRTWVGRMLTTADHDGGHGGAVNNPAPQNNPAQPHGSVDG